MIFCFRYYHMLEQPIFSINEVESLKQKALFIDCTKGTPSREIKSINLTKIPFDKTFDILKKIAAEGALYFNQKRLVVDLFSKAQFYYQLEKEQDQLRLNGVFTIRDRKYPLNSLDFLVLGRPSWFIKDQFLFVVDSDISSRVYSKLPKWANSAELLEILAEAKEEGITVQGLELFSTAQMDPLPTLILKDKTGAFADLWMHYGSHSFNYNDLKQNPLRNIPCEKGWETDLLETDFLKKQVGQTAYFCPLDKVTKSLGFLLEIGWTIIDHQGKKVVQEKGRALEADLKNGKILLSGKVDYEGFSADLSQVAGDFLKRNRFLNLDEHHVGLIDNTPFYENFVEEGEIVSEGIKLNRFCLKELFSSEIPIQFSPPLETLRYNLQNPLPAYHQGLFTGQLRAYQQKGVEWLLGLHRLALGGILADDMGLGKTIQVLAFVALLDSSSCHLIVAPTSLLFNWKKEITKFLPEMTCIVHHGSERTKNIQELPQTGIILTSYTTARMDRDLLKLLPINCLILDEAQVIKNQETQIAKALGYLSAHCRISLTGTPIENRLEELFSHFHFLIPGFLNEQDLFLKGMSNQRYLRRVQKKIQPFLLRRKKEEVASELPTKIEQVVYVEMTPLQKTSYNTYLSSFKKNTLQKVSLDGIGKHRIEIFEALLRLRQICCHPLLVSPEDQTDCGKLDTLISDVETVVSEGRKALIFSQFTSMLTLIGQELFKRNLPFVRLDGSTKDREKVVNEFQNSAGIPLFLISLKAGGVGLNLTAADHVFIYDPWWNEAIENQAISRAHRIGQSRTVVAKRYVALESIEEKIMKLKEGKNQLINTLFEEDFTFHQSLSNEDLLALFE
ncbi:hypothetical protein PHSC3_001966 [Chlamydiales bacterium STE3]|nr:hypothetical protein PHSC3_001966 [Chlamydiales bacterium STE3]